MSTRGVVCPPRPFDPTQSHPAPSSVFQNLVRANDMESFEVLSAHTICDPRPWPSRDNCGEPPGLEAKVSKLPTEKGRGCGEVRYPRNVIFITHKNPHPHTHTQSHPNLKMNRYLRVVRRLDFLFFSLYSSFELWPNDYS